MESTMMQTPLTTNLILERAGTLLREVEVISRRRDPENLHRKIHEDQAARPVRGLERPQGRLT